MIQHRDSFLEDMPRPGDFRTTGGGYVESVGPKRFAPPSKVVRSQPRAEQRGNFSRRGSEPWTLDDPVGSGRWTVRLDSLARINGEGFSPGDVLELDFRHLGALVDAQVELELISSK